MRARWFVRQGGGAKAVNGWRLEFTACRWYPGISLAPDFYGIRKPSPSRRELRKSDMEV